MAGQPRSVIFDSKTGQPGSVILGSMAGQPGSVLLAQMQCFKTRDISVNRRDRAVLRPDLTL